MTTRSPLSRVVSVNFTGGILEDCGEGACWPNASPAHAASTAINRFTGPPWFGVLRCRFGRSDAPSLLAASAGLQNSAKRVLMGFTVSQQGVLMSNNDALDRRD